MPHPFKVHDSRSRILAKLVRELLAAERYETLADLVSDLKQTCARYRIPWTNDDVAEALRLVGSNVPIGRIRLVRRGRPAPPVIDRDEAAAILQRLGVTVR